MRIHKAVIRAKIKLSGGKLTSLRFDQLRSVPVQFRHKIKSFHRYYSGVSCKSIASKLCRAALVVL